MAAGLMIKDALRTRLPKIHHQFQTLMPISNIGDGKRVQSSDYVYQSVVMSKGVDGKTKVAATLLTCRSKPTYYQERGAADGKHDDCKGEGENPCKSETTCGEAKEKVLNLAEICDDSKSEQKVLDLSVKECKNKLKEKCDLAGKKLSQVSLPGKLSDAGNELKKCVPDSLNSLTNWLKGMRETISKALGRKGN